MSINMKYCTQTGLYSADKDNLKILNEIMEANSVKHVSKRTPSGKDVRATKDIAATDDGSVRGSVRTLVEPLTSTISERRSKRRRTVITYLK